MLCSVYTYDPARRKVCIHTVPIVLAVCDNLSRAYHLIVDSTFHAWQATGWKLIEWAPDLMLLTGSDGGWCGGVGAEVS